MSKENPSYNFNSIGIGQLDTLDKSLRVRGYETRSPPFESHPQGKRMLSLPFFCFSGSLSIKNLMLSWWEQGDSYCGIISMHANVEEASKLVESLSSDAYIKFEEVAR